MWGVYDFWIVLVISIAIFTFKVIDRICECIENKKDKKDNKEE